MSSPMTRSCRAVPTDSSAPSSRPGSAWPRRGGAPVGRWPPAFCSEGRAPPAPGPGADLGKRRGNFLARPRRAAWFRRRPSWSAPIPRSPQEHLGHVGRVVMGPEPPTTTSPGRAVGRGSEAAGGVRRAPRRPLDRLPQLPERPGLRQGPCRRARRGWPRRRQQMEAFMRPPPPTQRVFSTPAPWARTAGVTEPGQLALGEVGMAVRVRTATIRPPSTPRNSRRSLDDTALLLPHSGAPGRLARAVPEGVESLGQDGRPLGAPGLDALELGVGRRRRRRPGPCAGPRGPRRRYGSRRFAPPAPLPGLDKLDQGQGVRIEVLQRGALA